VLWGEELCWVSAAGGRRKETEYLLLHCIPTASLLRQLDRSAARGALLPLLGARGGEIAAERLQSVEKNWGPFVGPDGRLHLLYSPRPHVVLACDWAAAPPPAPAGEERLRCEGVHRAENPYFPASGPHVDLRGSSGAARLPPPAGGGGGSSSSSSSSSAEYVAMGHVRSNEQGTKYKFFLYRFAATAAGAGGNASFRLTGWSPFFQLTSSGSAAGFDYAHGVAVEAGGAGGAEGGVLEVAFGRSDESAWRLRVPLARALALLAGGPGAAAAAARPLEAAASGPAEPIPDDVFGRGAEAGLERGEAGVRGSGHPAAAAVRALAKRLRRGAGFDEYAAAAVEIGHMWANASQAAVRAARHCDAEAAGADDPASAAAAAAACAEGPAAAAAAADAEGAFWAYAALLVHENRNVFAAAARANAAADAAGRRRGGRRRGGRRGAKLEYDAALKAAMRGRLDGPVLDALRAEHDAAEAAAAPVYRRVQARINLGVALLNVGNRAGTPETFGPAYEESERLLEGAARLNPTHAEAASNLAAVRRSREARGAA
jgi:hypothetical protein